MVYCSHILRERNAMKAKKKNASASGEKYPVEVKSNTGVYLYTI